MIHGTSKEGQNGEVAGYVMAFHLTAGLAMGSVVAALISLAVF